MPDAWLKRPEVINNATMICILHDMKEADIIINTSISVEYILYVYGIKFAQLYVYTTSIFFYPGGSMSRPLFTVLYVIDMALDSF